LLSTSRRLAYAALTVFAAACCHNEATYVLSAPDSSRVAILYHRDCGAMAGFGYHLSVVKSGSKPPWGLGNAVTFLNRDSLAPGVPRRRTVALLWVSSTQLLVAYDTTNTRAIRNAGTVRGIGVVLHAGIPDGLRAIPEP
jgi:hypothetical protein